MVHHVARAGHYETYVGDFLQHLGRGLDEIVGAFLVGDTPQERDDLVVHAPFGHFAVASGEPHGIVYRHDLVGRDAVAVDDDVAREVRNGDHPVCGVHACAFDGVDLRIDVLAAAVVFRGVHMHDQRLARYALGGDTGVVGEPVVGVDHVELPFEVFGHLRCDHGIAGDLLHKVGAVLAREGIALFPGIGRRPDFLSGFDVALLVLFILFGGDIRYHVRVDVDERHLLENVVRAASRGSVKRLHVTGIQNVRETLILVAVGVGYYECYVDIVACQPAGHPVTCRSQTTRDVGRELPTEH